MTERRFSDEGTSKTGKMHFCPNCQNIMDAVVQPNNKLRWECSINCPSSGDRQEEPEQLIVLSETIDDGVNVHLNPYNQFTIYDPALLRCKKDEPCPGCGKKTEMIIFKQNVATANSYFICTECHAQIYHKLCPKCGKSTSMILISKGDKEKFLKCINCDNAIPAGGT